jgi:peptidoglycan/LPS O-acetylase OafA/YrhL
MKPMQFVLLPQAQLGQESAQSLLIALLRGVAAMQVAAAHLRAEMFPSLRSVEHPSLVFQALAFGTGFAHLAVIVFFVISGWLVGGSLLNKLGQPGALGSYAIDRITRLWTVLLPAFVLMLLLGLLTGQLAPGAIDFSASNSYSATTLLGNLFGLQTIVVERFGDNFPLWSLANETWYYVMFPLLAIGAGSATRARRVASLGLLALVALALPYAITLYFLLWLLGAIFSRIRIDCGNAVRWALAAGWIGIAVLIRLKGSNDDLVQESFLQDLVFSLATLVFLSSMHLRPAPWLARLRALSQFFAEFSFTLYVTHVPLIRLLRWIGLSQFGSDRLSPGDGLDLLVYGAMFGIVLACCFISYLAFEAQTGTVRRVLKSLFLPAPQPALHQGGGPAFPGGKGRPVS